MDKKFRQDWTCVVLRYASRQTDRQTCRYADHNTSQPSRGEVKKSPYALKLQCCSVSYIVTAKAARHKDFRLTFFPCLLNNKLILGPPFVKRSALCYRTVVLSSLYVLSVTLVYYGQTVGWIKMKPGMNVGLGP